MTITAALVLFAVIWFLTLFVVLPIGLRTQGDVGDVVEGTHAGAPANLRLRRTLWIVTGISAVLWCLLAATIVFGWVTLDDIDLFRRFGPGSGGTDG